MVARDVWDVLVRVQISVLRRIKSKVYKVCKIESVSKLRQQIDISLKIIIVFLSTLLVLSIFNGAVTLFMVAGALGVTYIFVHYWERHFLRLQQQEKK